MAAGKHTIPFNYPDEWTTAGHHQMVQQFVFFSECTDCMACQQKKTMSLHWNQSTKQIFRETLK